MPITPFASRLAARRLWAIADRSGKITRNNNTILDVKERLTCVGS